MPQYSLAALGQAVRLARAELQMTQAELGTKAGYTGTGASLSISRIERGTMRPSADRLSAIACALGKTPEQLIDHAAQLTPKKPEHEDAADGQTLRARKAHTEARHAAVTETVAARAKETEEALRAFNKAHDAARDDFFLPFVATAKTIGDAAAPEQTVDEEPTGDGQPATALRLESMSARISQAIAAAAAGGIGGAALGSAAAYGTFAAAAAFGTASTGTAISTLSGVAATNATLAVLGGGTLAAGGAGMAGGTLLLTGMVAAPAAALAAAGFYYFNRRRSETEERRLRQQVGQAEAALDRSADGYGSLIGWLEDATPLCEYIAVHGKHALERWTAGLGPTPLAWNDLDDDQRASYQSFLKASASLAMMSSINLGAFLTAEPEPLAEMKRVIDETLHHVSQVIRDCF